MEHECTQYSKIIPILGIHQVEYPENCAFTIISIIITNHKIYFTILFMQHWGYLCSLVAGKIF
jgi:hypothetical protein